MKKSGLLLALSTLAGALLVGGTFAAWAVTDNADPFGVTISADPTDVEIPTEGTITLAWGETRTLEAISGMKRGDEKGPYSVGLLATTSDASAYEGTLAVELKTAAEGEARLIDYLEVKVFENNTKEGAALLTANKASSYKGAANITVSSGVEKVVYFYVSLANEISSDVWNVVNDHTVTLEVDWKEKAAAPVPVEEHKLYYKNVNSWGTVNAYAWDSEDNKNGEWPGVAMTLLRDDIFEIEIAESMEHVIFNNGTDQTDDLDINFATPYYNGTSWGTLPDAEPPVEVAYYVRGSFFNDWAVDEAYKMTKINENEYRLTGLALKENDELKVSNPALGDDGWFGSKDYAGAGTTMENRNIKVTADGTYTVKFYVDGMNENYVELVNEAA